MTIPTHIIEKDSKYNSKAEFRLHSNYSFLLAKENNWLDTLFPPDNKILTDSLSILTKEYCQTISQQFTTIKDLNQAFPHVYNKIHKSKWANTCFNHMVRYSTYNWTKKLCQDEALKYSTKKDFKQNNPSAYLAAYKNKWINTICQHMVNPSQKWTLELCQVEASKYSTKKEFKQNNQAAYIAAHKYGWVDIVCSHMQPLGNKYKRCIYAYEFPDNSVYIGLTSNFNRRHNNRFKQKNDTVNEYIQKTNLQPVLIQITNYVDVNDASKYEGFCLDDYKQKGWNILNKIKTGGIGGGYEKILKPEQEQIIIDLYTKGVSIESISEQVDFIIGIAFISKILKKHNIPIYDYNICKIEALKYNNLIDFSTNSPTAFAIAEKSNWINSLCSHMSDVPDKKINKNKPCGYWNIKENSQLEASKYKSRLEFSKQSPSAYSYSLKNNWMGEFFPITESDRGYWNDYNHCKIAASSCGSLKEFRENYILAYNTSSKNKWLDDFNLYKQIQVRKIQTFDEFLVVANTCTSRWDLSKKHSKLYEYARKNNWLDKVYPKYTKKSL